MKKKKVKDLKEICKASGLDHKGTKAQLLQRILGAEPVAPGLASSASGGEAPSGQNGEHAAQGITSGGEVPAGQNGEQAAEGDSSSDDSSSDDSSASDDDTSGISDLEGRDL